MSCRASISLLGRSDSDDGSSSVGFCYATLVQILMFCTSAPRIVPCKPGLFESRRWKGIGLPVSVSVSVSVLVNVFVVVV